jgi:hypothetical protein
MENLIIKLKKLKEIQPDPEYCQYSKLVILLKTFKEIRPEPEYRQSSKLAILGVPIFNWRLAFPLVSLLLILIAGGLFNYLKPTAPNLSAQSLETDLQNLNINIQLAKIEYYQKSREAISLALKEISENQTSHLNSLILELEKNQLIKEKLSPDEDIENLLEQLVL